jgi:hypothetical protein
MEERIETDPTLRQPFDAAVKPLPLLAKRS